MAVFFRGAGDDFRWVVLDLNAETVGLRLIINFVVDVVLLFNLKIATFAQSDLTERVLGDTCHTNFLDEKGLNADVQKHFYLGHPKLTIIQILKSLCRAERLICPSDQVGDSFGPVNVDVKFV